MTDDTRIPEGLEYLRVALERTRAVARQLVGLHLHDADELAARSGFHLRVVRRLQRHIEAVTPATSDDPRSSGIRTASTRTTAGLIVCSSSTVG
jgi:hypothetical protein